MMPDSVAAHESATDEIFGNDRVYRTLKLPQSGRQVLGLDLNRSESLLQPDQTIAGHKTRQRPAALRDFNPPMTAVGHKRRRP